MGRRGGEAHFRGVGVGANRYLCLLKKYPIGIQDFRSLREGGYLYVDKTEILHRLTTAGKYYFLSRPRRFGKSLVVSNLKDQVRELLEYLATTGPKPVLLIDEYDKPMLDQIDDPALADENRLILKDFYDTLKSSDPYIHFLFLTGISKFAKISVFSGLNNLNDITLDAKYATLCGYTDAELRHYFDEEVHEIAKTHQKTAEAMYDDIRLWYNGYSWRGEKVYNPFSILNFVSKGEFSNFWFATGHPSFLVKRLTAVFAYRIENVEVNPMIFDGASVDNIDYRSLLFQTGYLTITGENRERQTVTLNFPNNEVKNALQQYMLGGFAHRSHLDSQISALDLKEEKGITGMETAEIPAIQG